MDIKTENRNYDLREAARKGFHDVSKQLLEIVLAALHPHVCEHDKNWNFLDFYLQGHELRRVVMNAPDEGETDVTDVVKNALDEHIACAFYASCYQHLLSCRTFEDTKVFSLYNPTYEFVVVEDRTCLKTHDGHTLYVTSFDGATLMLEGEGGHDTISFEDARQEMKDMDAGVRYDYGQFFAVRYLPKGQSTQQLAKEEAEKEVLRSEAAREYSAQLKAEKVVKAASKIEDETDFDKRVAEQAGVIREIIPFLPRP